MTPSVSLVHNRRVTRKLTSTHKTREPAKPTRGRPVSAPGGLGARINLRLSAADEKTLRDAHARSFDKHRMTFSAWIVRLMLASLKKA